MEARALPRLRNCDGLWRKPIKGVRTGRPRPGSMTEYIRSAQLLPAHEIDLIQQAAPKALTEFQTAQAALDSKDRAPLSEWLKLFDALDPAAFDDAERGNQLMPEGRTQLAAL